MADKDPFEEYMKLQKEKARKKAIEELKAEKAKESSPRKRAIARSKKKKIEKKATEKTSVEKKEAPAKKKTVKKKAAPKQKVSAKPSVKKKAAAKVKKKVGVSKPSNVPPKVDPKFAREVAGKKGVNFTLEGKPYSKAHGPHYGGSRDLVPAQNKLPANRTSAKEFLLKGEPYSKAHGPHIPKGSRDIVASPSRSVKKVAEVVDEPLRTVRPKSVKTVGKSLVPVKELAKKKSKESLLGKAAKAARNLDGVDDILKAGNIAGEGAKKVAAKVSNRIAEMGAVKGAKKLVGSAAGRAAGHVLKGGAKLAMGPVGSALMAYDAAMPSDTAHLEEDALMAQNRQLLAERAAPGALDTMSLALGAEEQQRATPEANMMKEDYASMVSEDAVKPSDRIAAVAQAKPMLKKQVDQSPQLKPKEKKAIKTQLDSPAKLTQNIAKEQSGKSMSVSDQFTNALTYFAPNIIGMAIGGLFEGSAGAIAGEEKAGELAQQYRKSLMDERAMKVKERVEDPASKSLTPYQKQSLKLRERELKQRDEAEDRRNRVFSWQQEAKTEFSSKQQELYSGYEHVNSSLDAIDNLYDIRDPQTGVLMGRFNDLRAMAGQAPEAYVRLRSEVNNVISDFLRLKSGQTVTEQERVFLQKVTGNTRSSPEEFQAAIDQFRKINDRAERKMLMSIYKTQPLKRNLAKSLIDEMGRRGLDEDDVKQLGPVSPQAPNTEPMQVGVESQLEIIRRIKAGRK